jgi:hypothetical protein
LLVGFLGVMALANLQLANLDWQMIIAPWFLAAWH